MQATPEQAQEGLALVQVLSSVLDRLVGANATMARADPGQVTKFHAMKAPGISIQQYLERVHKYASCSNECFILALIYIDRLIQRNNFLLTDLNVHRVVITAILLAAKFFDDAYYNNAYYAKVGGVLVSEINGLEVDFLFRINFSLHVPPEEFQKYRVELLSHSSVTSTSPIPTLEQTYQAPAQVSPEVGSCSMEMVTEPYITMVAEPYEPYINPISAASQITPSPPASTVQVVEDASDPVHCQEFVHMQRANSMPAVKPAPVYHHPMPASAPRCAQPMGAMPQFPTAHQFGPQMIYPTMHHQHHGSSTDPNGWPRKGIPGVGL